MGRALSSHLVTYVPVIGRQPVNGPVPINRECYQHPRADPLTPDPRAATQLIHQIGYVHYTDFFSVLFYKVMSSHGFKDIHPYKDSRLMVFKPLSIVLASGYPGYSPDIFGQNKTFLGG